MLCRFAQAARCIVSKVSCAPKTFSCGANDLQGTLMEKTTAYRDGHAADTAANAASALQRGLESTGDALHSGIDKMANPARRVVDGLSSSAHSAVDALASSASHTASRITDQTRRLTEAPSKAVDRSKSMIQDRPFQAVGMALAVGFVLGRLSGR